MCIANLADYDDATAHAIWQHEFALQAGEKFQRQLAEVRRIGTETDRILSSLPATAADLPPCRTPAAPGAGESLSTQGARA